MTMLKNRVISIDNRKTSMRLALEEWNALDDICRREGLKRKKLLEIIQHNKPNNIGLTSSVRLFTLAYIHDFAKNAGFALSHSKSDKAIARVFNLIA